MLKYISTYVVFILLILGLACITQANNHSDLHATYSALLKRYVHDGTINYRSLLRERSVLHNYLETLSTVSRSTFDAWNTNEQLAYLINLYNAATLELILQHYPVRSIRDIKTSYKDPWNIPFITLFNRKVTLDYIEHEVLRKQYKEPRIHAALVCAATSCPPLRQEAYQGITLEKQLDTQVIDFLKKKDALQIDTTKNIIRLSSIFDWYAQDFDSVPAFIQQYVDQNIEDATIEYLPYDWSLNDRQ